MSWTGSGWIHQTRKSERMTEGTKSLSLAPAAAPCLDGRKPITSRRSSGQLSCLDGCRTAGTLLGQRVSTSAGGDVASGLEPPNSPTTIWIRERCYLKTARMEDDAHSTRTPYEYPHQHPRQSIGNEGTLLSPRGCPPRDQITASTAAATASGVTEAVQSHGAEEGRQKEGCTRPTRVLNILAAIRDGVGVGRMLSP